MKRLIVWLMIFCLVFNVAIVRIASCQSDDEKEPPEGYVDPSPSLADTPPEQPPLGISGPLDVILIMVGLAIVGYICLVTYLHYRKV